MCYSYFLTFLLGRWCAPLEGMMAVVSGVTFTMPPAPSEAPSDAAPDTVVVCVDENSGEASVSKAPKSAPTVSSRQVKPPPCFTLFSVVTLLFHFLWY